MGNFNSFMKIISGLKHRSVARMVPTFEALEPKDTTELNNYFQNGNLTTATLPKIIERYTHPVKPKTSISPFLATRCFTTPEELLNLLIIRWNIPDPLDKSKEVMEKHNGFLKRPVRLRVSCFLKMWIKNHFEDFMNNVELLQKLTEFVEDSAKENTVQSMVLSLIRKKKQNAFKESAKNKRSILKIARNVLNFG